MHDDDPNILTPKPARVRVVRLLGACLVALLVALVFLFAPDLFPPPGSPLLLQKLLSHWAVIFVVALFAGVFVALPRIFLNDPDDAVSDEIVIARERRKLKIAIISSLLIFPTIVLLSTMSFKYFGGYPALGIYSQAVLVLLAFLGTVWLAPSRRAYTPRIRRKRLEEFQKHNLFMLGWAIFMAGLTCFAMLPAMASLRARTHLFSVSFVSVLLVVSLVVYSTLVANGYGWIRPRSNPARDDEWARQLRARAGRIGYLALMAALASVYVIGLYMPSLLMLSVRVALFIGIALPAACYLYLDWRHSG